MTNEEAIDKTLAILANLIHKDYGAGPDGFKIFKDDVRKHMAKAKAEALKPTVKLPDDFPGY